MATVNRFEDLICWQKARVLVREVYTIFKSCDDRGFKDQIQRSAISIMNNTAEGFERGTKQELINYFYIAKGSSGEVRSMLYAALDIGYINMQTFKHVKSLAEECSRLIESFVRKVKSGSRRGLQYKQAPKEDKFKKVLEGVGNKELLEKYYPNG